MNNEKISIIHRHWIWANTVKLLFHQEIPKLDLSEPSKDIVKIMISPYGTYMCLWYALLFVVLEGLKDAKITIPDIEKEIKDIYKPLSRFRNAVFHPQEKYWSPKFFEIMQDEDSSSKIWIVHTKVGDFILEEIKKINLLENLLNKV